MVSKAGTENTSVEALSSFSRCPTWETHQDSVSIMPKLRGSSHVFLVFFVKFSKPAEDEENDAPKDLSAEADDLFSLGRKLVSLAVANSSGGGVSSFFSYTSPSAGVYEVGVTLCPQDLKAFPAFFSRR